MAHFAKINDDNEVLAVEVVDNANATTEAEGQQYLETHSNWPANMWRQTSYNTRHNTHALGGTAFRGNFALPGYTWDPANEIFWPPAPHASWVKNVSEARWQSPLGDEPALTSEQQSQNDAETHGWQYYWNESAYQADNTTGWDLTDGRA